jgi:hypothetical protein
MKQPKCREFSRQVPIKFVLALLFRVYQEQLRAQGIRVRSQFPDNRQLIRFHTPRARWQRPTPDRRVSKRPPLFRTTGHSFLSSCYSLTSV